MIVYDVNVGNACKQYRKLIKALQTDVACDTGYSVETISAFENGRCNNAAVLLWYFYNGMTTNYIERWKK